MLLAISFSVCLLGTLGCLRLWRVVAGDSVKAHSKHAENVSHKLGQRALKLLEQLEANDIFYSPVKRSPTERAINERHLRNSRQRILTAARLAGVLKRRAPSYLSPFKLKWHGLRAMSNTFKSSRSKVADE